MSFYRDHHGEEDAGCQGHVTGGFWDWNEVGYCLICAQYIDCVDEIREYNE